MAELVKIENTEMTIKEYNGMRVVTLDDICSVHKCERNRLSRHFERKRKHFIENEDYYTITRKELNDMVSPNSKIAGNPNIKTHLFTESGYLMVIKCLDDDLAWEVQRQLVNSYFKVKQEQNNNIEDIPPHLLVKRQPDWYITNEWKIDYLCDAYECTPKEYMHHLLKEISRVFDFDDARATYQAQTGDRHSANGCVIMFFPQIKKLADNILEFDRKQVEE